MDRGKDEDTYLPKFHYDFLFIGNIAKSGPLRRTKRIRIIVYRLATDTNASLATTSCVSGLTTFKSNDPSGFAGVTASTLRECLNSVVAALLPITTLAPGRKPVPFHSHYTPIITLDFPFEFCLKNMIMKFLCQRFYILL